MKLNIDSIRGFTTHRLISLSYERLGEQTEWFVRFNVDGETRVITRDQIEVKINGNIVKDMVFNQLQIYED